MRNAGKFLPARSSMIIVVNLYFGKCSPRLFPIGASWSDENKNVSVVLSARCAGSSGERALS